MKKIYQTKRASALLITLLMMGILMMLTLGISNLVIREISVTQSLVDSNVAYYNAEAGIENGLLALKLNDPGFEPNNGEVTIGNSKVTIHNQVTTIPEFDDKKPIFVNGLGNKCLVSNSADIFAIPVSVDQFYEECPEATYRRLGLNDTHIIPLFSNGKNVQDFQVEYYMNTSSSTFAADFQNMNQNYFDVLRWKIYGNPKTGENKTESIADFYPVVSGSAATRPVCLGTDGTINQQIPGQPDCIFPGLSVGKESNNQTLWSAARECYSTDAGDFVTGGQMIKKAGGADSNDAAAKAVTESGPCTMRSFIDSHINNYLVLTNMVNPNVVGIGDVTIKETLKKADIYYRVVASKANGEPKLTPDYARISATGYSKNKSVQKTLEVQYKSPGFLPVFNFSLYKTKEKE